MINIKNMLPFLVFFIFLSAYLVSAGSVTVCDSGCDYSDLTAALTYTNNTANSTFIDQENSLWQISPNMYFNISSLSILLPAIMLNASNITLDCRNSTFETSTGGGAGISVNTRNDETITNCNTKGYEHSYYFSAMSDSKVINSSSYGAQYGFTVSSSSNNDFSNLAVLQFYNKGIYTGAMSSSRITNCLISTTISSVAGIWIELGAYNVITNNTLSLISTTSYGGISFYKSSGSCTDANPYNNITNNNLIVSSSNNVVWTNNCGFSDLFSGNYWGHPNRPYFNCSIDFAGSPGDLCGISNDTSPYGQKDGWNLQSSFSGTNFTSLPPNAGTDYSNLANVTISKGSSQIKFNNTIDFDSAVNLDDYISMGSGFVSINAAGLKATGNDFNRTANVTLQVQSCNGAVIKHASSYYTSLSEIISYGDLCAAPLCTNIVCADMGSYGIITFTAQHFDGFGGSSGAVPEFSDITSLLALALVIGGFFVMRRRSFGKL